MSFPVAAPIDAPSSSSQTGKDAAASLGGTGPFLAEVGSNQVEILCDRYQVYFSEDFTFTLYILYFLLLTVEKEICFCVLKLYAI